MVMIPLIHFVHGASIYYNENIYCLKQVLGLEKSEFDWLCRHLGHTTRIHLDHYRATSNVIERIDVAKVLLMQDNGLIKQCAGKSLADIQFEGEKL